MAGKKAKRDLSKKPITTVNPPMVREAKKALAQEIMGKEKRALQKNKRKG